MRDLSVAAIVTFCMSESFMLARGNRHMLHTPNRLQCGWSDRCGSIRGRGYGAPPRDPLEDEQPQPQRPRRERNLPPRHPSPIARRTATATATFATNTAAAAAVELPHGLGVNAVDARARHDEVRRHGCAQRAVDRTQTVVGLEQQQHLPAGRLRKGVGRGQEGTS